MPALRAISFRTAQRSEESLLYFGSLEWQAVGVFSNSINV
jgi:hypothetical protein